MKGSNERVKHGSDLRATFTPAHGRRRPRRRTGGAPPRAPTAHFRHKPSATRALCGPTIHPMRDVGRIRSHSETKSGPRPLGPSFDAAVAELAERQHGVVALRQLRALGLGPGAIKRRSSNGRLHLVHSGVYAVGHRRLTANGHRMAAVLACGPRAVLGYRDAAALWGLRRSSRTSVDV